MVALDPWCTDIADALVHQVFGIDRFAMLVSLVVAADQLDLLKDLTIDYSEDLMGGGFRFTNPLAQRTFGCGNAFSLRADAPVTEDCTGFNHPR